MGRLGAPKPVARLVLKAGLVLLLLLKKLVPLLSGVGEEAESRKESEGGGRGGGRAPEAGGK